MKLTRKVILSALLLTFTSFTFAQQQTVKKNNETKKETQEETSVEDEYLNDVDGDYQSDIKDTALGNAANGTTPSVSLKITCTVTQID